MKVSVIGDGGWGTALSLLLHGYGHDVSLWGAFPDYIAEMRASRTNSRYLPGVSLPSGIRLTADPDEAATGADCVVLTVPSRFFADVCSRFRGLLRDHQLVVSGTKGFDEKRHCRMSVLAHEILQLDLRKVVVLSGPSKAEEVARQLPTSVVAACDDLVRAEAAQSLFSGPCFRVYASTDPLGTEIGGAVKNVIAVAVGVSDGMGFGDNSRAALISRGLEEMTRFGTALGARPETFAGLSGIGDLILTCCSRHSRNHMVGERLGRGERIGDILASMQMVAEGVWNSHIVHSIAEGLDVEMPISSLVHQFCDKGLPPQTALESLMDFKTMPGGNP